MAKTGENLRKLAKRSEKWRKSGEKKRKFGEKLRIGAKRCENVYKRFFK